MIVTANIYSGMAWNEFMVKALVPRSFKRGINFVNSFVDDKPLQAEVNQGRWIVKCECSGAEYAWEEGVFLCQSCWNSTHKHQLRKSVFPKQRKSIEEALDKRPLMNRNWSPGETLAQLRAENKDHKEELLA